MTGIIDRHGQPFNPVFNRHLGEDHDAAEVLGLAKDLLADGVIREEESLAFSAWLDSHPEALRVWPCSVLAKRLTAIFKAGELPMEEREDLADLRTDLESGDLGMIALASEPTSFPLDSPPPPVLFQGKTFCIAGKFATGPRRTCINLIGERGGYFKNHVNHAVDYLVIGTFASRDWVQTSWRRKIEEAMEAHATGHPVAIISEDHWAAALDTGGDRS